MVSYLTAFTNTANDSKEIRLPNIVLLLCYAIEIGECRGGWVLLSKSIWQMCVVKDDDGRQASQGKTKKGATRDAGKDEGANETTE